MMVDARHLVQTTTEVIEEFASKGPNEQMEWMLHNPMKALVILWFLVEYYKHSEATK